MKMRGIFICITLLFYFFSWSETPLKTSYTKEELMADFNQLRQLIETEAISAYKFTTKEDFNCLFNQQIQAINGPKSLREFYNLLLPLKAKIGCGHCHLDYPSEYRKKEQIFKFPLVLTFINNRCFVKENLQPKVAVLKYSEIVAINGIKILQIIRTLKGDISADGYNDGFKTAALGDCFQYYYANRYGTPSVFQIEFKVVNQPGSHVFSVPALSCSGINYSNKKPSKLRFNTLPNHNTAIMTVDSFIYYGKKNKVFFDYVDDAFRQIKEENLANLIIDLRGNSGGDPFCASYLLSYIEKKPTIYFSKPYGKYAPLAKPIPMAKNHFTGNLFILIDGSNFSTTGHFCSLVKYHRLATFVGSETGSTYTCNAAVKGFTLKNTMIYVKLSTKSFSAAVTGFRDDRGIIPHHLVTPSINDFKKSKDKVLEYTLQLIRNKGKCKSPLS